MERSAGIILHPSALPNNYGIGNFGISAYRFVDTLRECGFKLWQVCPLGPTGYGDSPYQCFSAFAGNPYYIDWVPLIEEGLIKKNDLDCLLNLPHCHVDYASIYQLFWPLIKKTFCNFKQRLSESQPLSYDLVEFYNSNADWIYDYCNFRSLKDRFNQASRCEWPENFRIKSKILNSVNAGFISEEAELHGFTQFLFFNQFHMLKKYANSNGVKIIGDIPIFVAIDSADVWANPDLFKINKSGYADKVAGVPPDYFSKEGQLWGNPLFNWKVHEKENFNWWLNRLEHNLKLYDCARIDHFRGFESYWAVDARAESAINGVWESAPGSKLFKLLSKKIENLSIIAEDLGVITPEVKELLYETKFPGMAVLQFAFGGSNSNPYLPHNLKVNQVVYSGTHDNDTSLGWFESLDDRTKANVQEYLGISGENIGWDLFRCAISSVSNYAIVPLQDLLSLGRIARFNKPGTTEGNWSWRFTQERLDKFKSASASYIKNLLMIYGR